MWVIVKGFFFFCFWSQIWYCCTGTPSAIHILFFGGGGDNKQTQNISNESLQKPVQRGLRNPIKSGSQVLFVGCCFCLISLSTCRLSSGEQTGRVCSKKLNKLPHEEKASASTNSTHTLLLGCSGLLLPSVCRGKARRHLPSRCPLPRLNQLSSFASFVRVSKQAACFSFSAPAAKQPAALASLCKGSRAFIPKCGALPSQRLWPAAAPCLHRSAGRFSFGGNLARKRCRVSNRIFQELVEVWAAAGGRRAERRVFLFEMLKTSGLDRKCLPTGAAAALFGNKAVKRRWKVSNASWLNAV